MPTLRDVPVLVTGATGFIGGRLARRLAREEGARVTGTGRDLDKARHLEADGVKLERADLLYSDAVRRLVEGKEVIFHAAASLLPDPDVARAVNVTATGQLVRLAAAAGVRRFVHVSTVGAYRMEGEVLVDESFPLATESPGVYARTKALAEVRARDLADEHGMELAIVRPSMVYGPGPGVWTVMMFESIRDGKPVLLGDGSGHFQPVYIDDVVDALILCATSDAAPGEAFNITAGTITWREFMGRYGDMLGKEPKSIPLWLARTMAQLNRLPFLSLPIDVGFVEMATNRVDFCNDKARERLGWTPKVDLDEGMERTENWLRSQGMM